MRIIFFAVLSIALLLAMAQTPVVAATVTAADLARAQERIEKAKRQVEKARGELSHSQAQLRDAEKSIARVGSELRKTRVRDKSLAGKLSQLEAERDVLAKKTAAQARVMAREMRDAWMLGRQPPLRLWLGAKNPAQMARITRYYHYIHRDRAARLLAWQQEKEKLELLRVRIVAEQQTLAAVRRELTEHQQALRLAGDARRRAVAKLAGELRSRNDELKRRRDDEAALKKLFSTVREAFRDIPPDKSGTPFRQRKGKLRWPAAGRIQASFGSALAEGRLSLHGLVIGAAEGSEVRAVHAGRVVYADWLRGYGLLTILDHGDGCLSVYGHNQSLTRAGGDWVGEGDVVATVGVSGGRASPGLYFEIRVGGEPVDPARWLRR